MNQSDFALALLDPDLQMPKGLVDPNGDPAPRRFSVYRNNVAVGLKSALELGFPVIRQLVGTDFFAAMAGEFLRKHPPKSRIMAEYGDEFPQFLAVFPPAAHLRYLPDVARLEQALRESYHAADAVQMPMDRLAGLSEAALLAARFRFAPSLRLIRSTYPIHAIWRANVEAGPTPEPGAQDVVVLRHDFDPKPHLLTLGSGAVLEHLLAGQSVEQALADTSESFDLTPLLSLLIQSGVLIGLSQ